MKICYIYREKEKNEHSIEAVFDTVSDSISFLTTDHIYKWYKPIGWIKTILELFKLRSKKFDIYHITGDVLYLWPFLPWNKTILTIHDIGMYKNNPHTITRTLYVFISIFLASFFVRNITCVSDLTKNDVVKLLKVKSSKLIVIPNPTVQKIKFKSKEFNSTKPTIMQIGTGWHKNLIGLIESVKNLECKIDIVGKPDQDLIDKMKNYGIDYSISSNLSEVEIAQHYYDCDILYFVSNSEGFGLPILEAQMAGRPVITSVEEPMKTVAGENGALHFKPNDYNGIRNGILQICSDKELRKNLINNGIKNVDNFNPHKIAKEYIDLYKNSL